MRGAAQFTFVACVQDDLADILASTEKLMHRAYFFLYKPDVGGGGGGIVWSAVLI